MKNVFVILLSVIFLASCTSTSRRSLRTPASNVIDLTQPNDEGEYELIVLDPGFDTWYATRWSPAKDRSVQYYHQWNYQYVTAWNIKATQPSTAEFFSTTINYDPSIDYGIELERKLYYYFRYVDTRLGIPILNNRPPGSI